MNLLPPVHVYYITADFERRKPVGAIAEPPIPSNKNVVMRRDCSAICKYKVGIKTRF